MRLLIIGDSITEGKLGQSYIPGLLERLPGLEIVNLGLGGDTVFGMKKRAMRYLRRDNRFDVVLVVGGHNDVILPAFERMSLAYRMVARAMIARGSLPFEDKKIFDNCYESLIDMIRRLCPAKIVLSTLSCINESLEAETNRVRAQLNGVIRELASRHNFQLADVAEVFDRQLGEGGGRDYFMDRVNSTFFIDNYSGIVPGGLERLSEKRGLKLTIDGVHLNSAGAAIYSEVIAGVLNTFT